MSDTPPTDPPQSNNPVLTVSEISGAVKRTLEGAFAHVRVRGEISRPNYHASGHLYLTLKDEQAVIDAVCWRGKVRSLSVRAEQGLEVIVTGRVSSYPGSSKYQIVIETMEPAGEGAILKLLEERKRKLAAEGLFDAERKRPIPYLPTTIGVISSPTGAVIRDILHRIEERFPRHVLLWPVRVQGEGAAEEIAAAIEGFNALPAGGALPRPDVLIVARGGGSLEDLWAFNEEIVVRAAAASAIPLISAVGHETDTTLIDFASDRRAPTPTAAAEIAVPVRGELLTEIAGSGQRLLAAAGRSLRERRTEVAGLARGLPEPRRLLEEAWQRLDDRVERLMQGMAGLLQARRGGLAELTARLPHPRQQLALAGERLEGLTGRLTRVGPRLHERAADPWHRLDAARRMERCLTALLAERGRELSATAGLLESLSHRRVLERGFAYVEQDGELVTRAAQVPPGADLTLTFADGGIVARAEGVAPPSGGRRKAADEKDKPGKPGKTGKPEQGSLL